MTLADLPTPPPGWTEALEKAAMRLRWLRQDWQRHFSVAMSFDEYNFIAGLQRQVNCGELDPARARHEVEQYRKATRKCPTSG